MGEVQAMTFPSGESLGCLRLWASGRMVWARQNTLGGRGMAAMSATADDRAALREQMVSLDARYQDAIVTLAKTMVSSPMPPSKTWFKRRVPHQRGKK